MRESDLVSPDLGAKGYHLRRCMVSAISQLQVNAAAFGGRHPGATAFAAFLAEAKTANDLLLPVAPTQSFAPTAKTYSIAAGATVGPTLSKGGSDGAVTYSSATPAKATVNASTGYVTGIEAGTSVITATTAAYGGYLATTKTYVATVEA